jgi:hypothetical protein
MGATTAASSQPPTSRSPASASPPTPSTYVPALSCCPLPSPRLSHASSSSLFCFLGDSAVVWCLIRLLLGGGDCFAGPSGCRIHRLYFMEIKLGMPPLVRANCWTSCTGSARWWGSSAACFGESSPSSAPSRSCCEYPQNLSLVLSELKPYTVDLLAFPRLILDAIHVQWSGHTWISK